MCKSASGPVHKSSLYCLPVEGVKNPRAGRAPCTTGIKTLLVGELAPRLTTIRQTLRKGQEQRGTAARLGGFSVTEGFRLNLERSKEGRQVHKRTLGKGQTIRELGTE